MYFKLLHERFLMKIAKLPKVANIQTLRGQLTVFHCLQQLLIIRNLVHLLVDFPVQTRGVDRGGWGGG
jgi:hypothetical protein